MYRRPGEEQCQAGDRAQDRVDDESDLVTPGDLENQPGRDRAYSLAEGGEGLGHAADGAKGLAAEEISVGYRGDHEDAGDGEPEQTGGEESQRDGARDDEQRTGHGHDYGNDGVGVRNPHLLDRASPQQAAQTRPGRIDDDAQLSKGKVNATGSQQVGLVHVGSGLQQEEEAGSDGQDPQSWRAQGLSGGPFQYRIRFCGGGSVGLGG